MDYRRIFNKEYSNKMFESNLPAIDSRKDIIKRVLFLYGEYIFMECFSLAIALEKYEDCALFKEVAFEYGIKYNDPDSFVLNYNWKIAPKSLITNLDTYYVDACRLLNYI